MPGGGVMRGETLEQAARREAREEVGADMGVLTLYGAYTHLSKWNSDHNILFLCKDFNLSGKNDKEIAEARFFPLDNLPDETWPGHRRRIEEFSKGIASPQFGEW